MLRILRFLVLLVAHCGLLLCALKAVVEWGNGSVAAGT
jgi:hypothetical protein